MGRAGHRHYGTGWAELGQDGYGQVRTGWVKQDGNGPSMHITRAGSG
jgi:hypothetical protein